MLGNDRKLAAIMFTDMVGYTAMVQRDEGPALEMLEDHRKVVRSFLSKYKGTEIKTIGDAFLVEFVSALEAVRCAFDIQKSIHESNSQKPLGKKIFLRIGIHLGDVIHSQNDVYGDAVNVASRIEPLAEPGGVSFSQQVYDHVRNKSELPIVKVGDVELKNVELPIGVYKLMMPWNDNNAGQSSGDKISSSHVRIAVLPFVNISPDPSDEYFADGLTEELITKLCQISELKVIARTSVMNYKKREKKASEIGKELGVGSIIEGSVRKAGNRIRATVQLIDASNEEHLWASNYDRQLDDIFAIQTEIAESVTEQLRIRLRESQKGRLERKPTSNTEAYTLYLKGRHYWNERSDEGVRKAMEYFKRTIEIDPTFALGYSGLADCYQIQGHNHMGDFVSSYKIAKQYATKAIQLQEDLAQAHTTLAGVLADYDHDWGRAESEFRRAIELNPSYSTGHQWYAIFLGTLGRFKEGESEILKALELDPLSLIINVNVGDSLYYQREYVRAIEQYEKVMEVDPNFAISYYSAIQSYAHEKMYEKALQASETSAKLMKRPAWGKLQNGYVYASMGKTQEARESLKEAEESYETDRLSPYFFAMAYFQMNDNDAGFEWLQRAYDEHDSSIIGLRIDYEFDKARDDPRYIKILQDLYLA